MKRSNPERGAAAVEFALLLPVLLLLVLGIMEFGRLYNIQISASNAAREGARYAAVHYTDSGYVNDAAISAARNSAPTLPASTQVIITYSAGACSAGSTVKVTVRPPATWMTGYLPMPAPQITGVGVMQCGG
ncbi:pilus assembly protein [Arthrobacter silviterrae]|uniref:Pilus assembly protein n=1 Tax=Arthrobacter silviterrae TaxID=2026658 RepID=A0ABX0DHF4_9MICC|nr:pilus assembly protein [Arthrobacter silviterrae]